MDEKKRSLLLVRVLPIALVLLFFVFVLQVGLRLFPDSKKQSDDVIPSSYLKIYAYGNVEREGPFYVPSGKKSIKDIALLAGMEFSSDYYEFHNLDNLYKITYSDCEVIEDRHVLLLYFPPDNIFPVYSLNEVKGEELFSFGLTTSAVDRILSYRESVGKIENKSDLLTKEVLSPQEYAFLRSNIETLPDSIRFLMKGSSH